VNPSSSGSLRGDYTLRSADRSTPGNGCRASRGGCRCTSQSDGSTLGRALITGHLAQPLRPLRPEHTEGAICEARRSAPNPLCGLERGGWDAQFRGAQDRDRRDGLVGGPSGLCRGQGRRQGDMQ